MGITIKFRVFILFPLYPSEQQLANENISSDWINHKQSYEYSCVLKVCHKSILSLISLYKWIKTRKNGRNISGVVLTIKETFAYKVLSIFCIHFFVKINWMFKKYIFQRASEINWMFKKYIFQRVSEINWMFKKYIFQRASEIN